MAINLINSDVKQSDIEKDLNYLRSFLKPKSKRSGSDITEINTENSVNNTRENEPEKIIFHGVKPEKVTVKADRDFIDIIANSKTEAFTAEPEPLKILEFDQELEKLKARVGKGFIESLKTDTFEFSKEINTTELKGLKRDEISVMVGLNFINVIKASSELKLDFINIDLPDSDDQENSDEFALIGNIFSDDAWENTSDDQIMVAAAVNEAFGKGLDSIIDSLIALADLLESKMDLSLTDTSGEVVKLLEKFMEILKKLDKETRDIIETRMMIKDIDERFLNEINDSDNRWETLAKMWNEVVSIIESTNLTGIKLKI